MKQRYRQNGTLVLVLLLLAIAVLPLSRASAQAETGTGTVDPSVGSPGTTFTFQAGGFGSSERIGIWLSRIDENGELTEPLGDRVEDYRIFADVDGNLTWTWTAPDDVAGGEWRMIARGAVSRYEVIVPFVIERAAPAPPDTSWFVEPPAGTAGTTFMFVGRSKHFIPGEQVGSWFIQPNGEPLNVEQGMSVDPTGQIFRLWTAPPGAYGGVWVFRAVGISSGHNIDMTFTIDGPEAPPREEKPIVMSVTPEQGPPGTLFTFTAEGFAPEELVSNWFVLPGPDEHNTSIDTPQPWLQANGQGAIVWQWTAPPDAPGGLWRWQLSGTQTPGRQGVDFQIISDTPVPPEPTTGPGTIQPPGGLPDTVFRISVEGFQSGEGLFYWAEDPNGESVEVHEEVHADSQGRAEWTWESPHDAMAGSWTLVVRGRLSPITIQIPFIIFDPAAQPPFSVQPAVGGPGTTFTFTAIGYNSGEILSVWASGPPDEETGLSTEYSLEGIQANRHGIAEWDWTAPAEIPAGDWDMIAEGRVSRQSNHIPFTIVRDTPPPDPERPYGVTPESGPPGTTFQFYGEGFQKHERVSVWLTTPPPEREVVRINPDADDEDEADEIGSDENGRVDVAWTAPPDAPRGLWHLTMRTSLSEDFDEDITYVIYFTVE
jgi:hypothetical protein